MTRAEATERLRLAVAVGVIDYEDIAREIAALPTGVLDNTQEPPHDLIKVLNNLLQENHHATP